MCVRIRYRQLLPQDRAVSREKGQPLCMAQYPRLFASYRSPGLEQDQLKTQPANDDNEHIIVAYQGQVYFPVTPVLLSAHLFSFSFVDYTISVIFCYTIILSLEDCRSSRW